MRLLSSLLLLATLAAAGPVEFAQAELDSAMAQRKLKWKNQVELSLDAPDTFRIEPYSMGGAHITGGDLRGLMYGLLEAAEQIRDSGHFTKTIGNPAASLRGVRIVMTPELEAGARGILELVFPHAGAEPLQPGARGSSRGSRRLTGLPQFLSRTAADYGIDFTLGIGGGVSAEELAHVLIVCPSIRGVALEDASAQAAVFSALRVAGRRVTLDLDGATAEPAVLQAALAEGVPVLRPAAAWPPSFEVAPPIDAANAEAHPVFYEVMGRLSYDPKSKPAVPRGAGDWVVDRGGAAIEFGRLGICGVRGGGGARELRRRSSRRRRLRSGWTLRPRKWGTPPTRICDCWRGSRGSRRRSCARLR